MQGRPVVAELPIFVGYTRELYVIITVERNVDVFTFICLGKQKSL